jgi:hypothetical protein
MSTQTALLSLHSSSASRSALQFSNSAEEPYEVYELQGETIVARLRELADRTVRFPNAESDIEYARRTR